MRVRCIDFESVSTIFQLNIGTFLTMFFSYCCQKLDVDTKKISTYLLPLLGWYLCW